MTETRGLPREAVPGSAARLSGLSGSRPPDPALREFTVSTKVLATDYLDAAAKAAEAFSGTKDAVITMTRDGVGTWSLNPTGHPGLFGRAARC